MPRRDRVTKTAKSKVARDLRRHTYKTIEKSSPGAYNTIVMGPWCHACSLRTEGESLGNVKFGAKTGVFYRDEIEFPFFAHFLKDEPDPKLPEAVIFETGINEWRREDAWPPQNATEKTLFFHPGGKLRFDPPQHTTAAFDEYVFRSAAQPSGLNVSVRP